MIEQCTTRPVEPDDMPRLHEIRNAAYTPVFKSFRHIVGPRLAELALTNLEKEQGDYLDEICKPDSSHEVFVVEREGKIVAFCSYVCNQETKLGVVDLNAVDPTIQNAGVGTWMYKHALDQLRKAGMRAAEVGTGGDDSHAPARRAYAKAGFGPGIPSVYFYMEL